MKRTKKEVEKRTYALKNAFPRFVSVVDRGANYIPFSGIRFAEGSDKFSDVEINKIVFAKETFASKEAVEAYLNENNYEEFAIEETDTTFYVAGLEDDKFSEVSQVEYDDGILYFIGKLIAPVEDAPVTDIVESEELVEDGSVAFEEGQEEASEATEEVVAHEESNEEAKSEETDTSSQEGEGGNSAEVVQEAQEEVVAEDVVLAADDANTDTTVDNESVSGDEPVVDKYEQFASSLKFGSDYADFRHQLEEARENGNFIFTFDHVAYLFMDTTYSAVREGNMDQLKKNCSDFYKAVNALYTASKSLAFSEEVVIEEEVVAEVATTVPFSITKEELDAMLEEKIAKFSAKTNTTVDNEVIVIQNSQRVNTDELIVTTDDKSEEQQKSEQFNAQTKKDMYGIR